MGNAKRRARRGKRRDSRVSGEAVRREERKIMGDTPST
jgi:hypothetical protein